MLKQPLLEKLTNLKMPGFIKALEEQMENPSYMELSFEERLAMLIDREWTRRENTRLERNIKNAKFHETALIEDLDMSKKRELDRSLILELAQGQWVQRHLNAIVLGPTGAGKTYLACALGQAVCRIGKTVLYIRTSRLHQELKHAHADGSFAKLLNKLAKTDLLILDDWLRDPLTAAQTRDLLEIMDDRHKRKSTVLATQIPVDQWHDRLSDPTLADAMLDRLIHNSYRLELKGESQRKVRSQLLMSST